MSVATNRKRKEDEDPFTRRADVTTFLTGKHTGFGVVGLGVGGSPSPTRKRPDLCAEHGHPGVTYHPQMLKTWCLCGEVIYDGNQFQHAACCGGPLEERLRPALSGEAADPTPDGGAP